MSDDLLLRFLSNGLIDVGGDDAKLEKLRQTASDLAGNLQKSPSSAVTFSLVAFDPYVPAGDPVVAEVLTALEKHWVTYANTFAGPPVAVVRAMLLDALALAAAANDLIGVAFTTLARNALSFMEAGGEQAIWADVITEIEKRVDACAEAVWATPSSITVPAMTLAIPDLPVPKVTFKRADRNHLKTAFRAAAGPQYHDPKKGYVDTGGNPNWPGGYPQWVTEFANHMAEGVAKCAESVSGSITIKQPDLSESLGALATSVSSYLDGAIKDVSAATAGLERRANLLWWKEALFSPAARVSYRELPPASAAAMMAFDVHQLVPALSPASVASFLFEAVVGLPSIDQEKTHTVRELVADAQAEPKLAALRSAGADLMAFPAGRGPLLALIAYPDAPMARDELEFQRLTGLSADAPFTLPEWAAWIFRELQAARAVRADPTVR